MKKKYGLTAAALSAMLVISAMLYESEGSGAYVCIYK